MRDMMQSLRWTVWGAAGLMLAATLPGCGEQKASVKAKPTVTKEEPTKPAAEPTATPAAKPVAKPATEPAATKPTAGAGKPDPKVAAVLAKADGVDGKTDKVVSKCAGCALGMDGDAKHASTVSGYKLHLCSEHCKAQFDKNPGKVILALKVPK